jgi:hypothetical protein
VSNNRFFDSMPTSAIRAMASSAGSDFSRSLLVHKPILNARAEGRFGTFATWSASDLYLRIPAGWNRRKAAIEDRHADDSRSVAETRTPITPEMSFD